MDQGRAYAIAVLVVVVATAIASVLSVAVRQRRTRHAVFALIRQDLTEVRTGRAHLHHAPSGSSTGHSPGPESDGPQAGAVPPQHLRQYGAAS
ncbi:hypothetical protein ACIRG5_42250 [Lentzea sp. NPDC102401]|uniref:hypothetical protein n=1 Tax=Lentzea sp. NPDC102401 TaxID=3364128 RepID=UPI0037FE0167